MTDLFLAPHNDDETLFGSFTLIRHRPHVAICLRSKIQELRGGPTHWRREDETNAALEELGVETWEQLDVLDDRPDWDALRYELHRLKDELAPERVWAPAIEDGGHDQHNGVGALALEVFVDADVIQFLTYVRGAGRTRGLEVPFEPRWASLKMRALACYESQMELGSTLYWFIDDTLREFAR